MTGAFHEDAVADFCDAFGGGYTTDDVLRIMKDSRVGSYGVLGLLLAVGLRAGLTVVLLGGEAWYAAAAIVAAACFGRLTAVALMAIVRPVGSGLGKDVAGKVGQSTLLMAIATAVPGLAAFLLLEPLRLIAVVAVALMFLGWFRALLLRRIGGSTGDCLGFAAYAGQLILLLAATAGR
jgi:adenosylcobinamide-GDP ribazoletransferase